MGYQVGRICYGTEAEAVNIVMTQVVPMIDKDGVLHPPVFNGRTWTYKQQGHEYPVKPTFPQCDPNEYTNAGREVGIALLGAFVVVWIKTSYKFKHKDTPRHISNGVYSGYYDISLFVKAYPTNSSGIKILPDPNPKDFQLTQQEILDILKSMLENQQTNHNELMNQLAKMGNVVPDSTTSTEFTPATATTAPYTPSGSNTPQQTQITINKDGSVTTSVIPRSDLVPNGTTNALHCCCEATGKYYEAAADYLAESYVMSVENPRKIKGYGNAKLQRSKTDRLDARLIAEYCRDMKPRAWQKPSEAQTKLKELNQYCQRLKAQKAAEQTKLHTAPDYLAPLIEETIRHLQKQIKAVQEKIGKFHQDHPDYKAKRSRLKTITGIGDNAADTLLTVLAEKHRFENQRQFIAYLGLDPKQFKSGTSVKGRERISKVGSSRLRTALYMPAMHAYRSRTFAPFVSRLQANGKRPKQIIVALMRKLAVIAYNLIKTGKDFEPQRYISQNQ